MIKINDWSITGRETPYTAPELIKRIIAGKVYGHHRFPDGSSVFTSSIKKVKGRKITTSSGSEYRLGKIDPKYRKWLKKERPDWDWRNPVKVI